MLTPTCLSFNRQRAPKLSDEAKWTTRHFLHFEFLVDSILDRLIRGTYLCEASWSNCRYLSVLNYSIVQCQAPSVLTRPLTLTTTPSFPSTQPHHVSVIYPICSRLHETSSARSIKVMCVSSNSDEHDESSGSAWRWLGRLASPFTICLCRVLTTALNKVPYFIDREANHANTSLYAGLSTVLVTTRCMLTAVEPVLGCGETRGNGRIKPMILGQIVIGCGESR